MKSTDLAGKNRKRGTRCDRPAPLNTSYVNSLLINRRAAFILPGVIGRFSAFCSDMIVSSA
ncbi:hypothetical protein [Bradyrhizobium sp. SZCCHNR1015]|uniref:hypothetical protein n=1 Tax=Bradyrhizobium sp. SZCCHNR1015 TaxID=3057338 RepID=UPI002915E632|nr:hypothetical protein [Bradyrhizobium sp. SZCCHNR1015]